MTDQTLSAQPARLDNIQALRGVAALAVLLYHLALFIRDGVFVGQSGFPAGPWDQGWAGVDLFFVISGFIMVWTTQNTSSAISSSTKFLWRRVTRIYPLWWFCAAIMAVYFLLAYNMPAAPDRVAGPQEAWSYAIKSFALWPQDTPPLLGLGWTLIHEMWFYIAFAGLLILPRKFLMPSLIIWGGVTFLHYAVLGAVDEAEALRKLITSPLTVEFIGGALMACLLVKQQVLSRNLAWIVFAAGLIWVSLSMVFNIRFAAEDHHFIRTIIYGPAMLALVWGSTALALNGGLHVPVWLVRLGDWSYALYLIHYIVLIGLKRVLTQIGWGETGSMFTVIIFGLVAMTLSLIAAWGLHVFFEMPVIRFFRRREGRSPAQMSE